MVRLPDYRLVEDYQNSSFAREAAERKKLNKLKLLKHGLKNMVLIMLNVKVVIKL